VVDDIFPIDKPDEETQPDIQPEIPSTGGVASPSDIAESTLGELPEEETEPSGSSAIDAAIQANAVDSENETASVKHADIIKPTIKDEELTPEAKKIVETVTPITGAVQPEIKAGDTPIPVAVQPEIKAGETSNQTIIHSNTTTETHTSTHTENRIESKPSTVVNLTVNNPVESTKDEVKVTQTNPTLPTTTTETTIAPVVTKQSEKPILVPDKNSDVTTNTTISAETGTSSRMDPDKASIFNLYGITAPGEVGNPNKESTPTGSALSAANKEDKTTTETAAVKSNSPSTPSTIVNSVTGEQEVISEQDLALRDIFSSLNDPTAYWVTGQPKKTKEEIAAINSPSAIAKEASKPTEPKNSEITKTQTNTPTVGSTGKPSDAITPSTITNSVVNEKPKTTEEPEVTNQADVHTENNRTDVQLIESPEIRVDRKSKTLTPAIVKNILTSPETRSLNEVNASLAGVKSSLDASRETQVTNNQSSSNTSNSTTLVNNADPGKTAPIEIPKPEEIKKDENKEEGLGQGGGMTDFYLHAIYDALTSQGIKIKSYS
jgi:hypothetical protein